MVVEAAVVMMTVGAVLVLMGGWWWRWRWRVAVVAMKEVSGSDGGMTVLGYHGVVSHCCRFSI